MPRVVKVVRESNEPVYQQIARQIRFGVGSGTLAGGVQLPSVRSLASELGVNLNTVARAYRLLKEEGFVTIQGRGGVWVAIPAASAEERISQILQTEFRALLYRMRQAGFRTDEIAALAAAEVERLGKIPGSKK